MAKMKAFSSPASAALLTGTLAAGLVLLEATQRKLGFGGLYALPTASVLLLAPGIATRSPKRVLKGFFLGLLWPLLSPLLLFTMLNGRLDLPLTVLITPGIEAMQPGIGTTWQTKAILTFLCFWVFVDVVMLALRDRPIPKGQISDRIGKRPERAALAAIAWSNVVMVLLYRLSWEARLSGTFQFPLYSNLAHTRSLVIFACIFPLKAWLLNYLYDAFSLKKAHDQQG